MSDFKESEHPRQKDGKFTDKGNIQGRANEKRDRLLIALDFFSKNKRKHSQANSEKVDCEPPKDVFGFEGKALTSPDHLDHMKEMGFKTPKEYQKAAINFWNAENGNTYYGWSRKRFYKYNEATNEMIVVSSGGKIFTFYRVNKKKFGKISEQEELELWKK